MSKIDDLKSASIQNNLQHVREQLLTSDSSVRKSCLFYSVTDNGITDDDTIIEKKWFSRQNDIGLSEFDLHRCDNMNKCQYLSLRNIELRTEDDKGRFRKQREQQAHIVKLEQERLNMKSQQKNEISNIKVFKSISNQNSCLNNDGEKDDFDEIVANIDLDQLLYDREKGQQPIKGNKNPFEVKDISPIQQQRQSHPITELSNDKENFISTTITTCNKLFDNEDYSSSIEVWDNLSRNEKHWNSGMISRSFIQNPLNSNVCRRNTDSSFSSNGASSSFLYNGTRDKSIVLSDSSSQCILIHPTDHNTTSFIHDSASNSLKEATVSSLRYSNAPDDDEDLSLYHKFSACGSNDETPLCSGHNLPCRLLTAKTSVNLGRQFYKCPQPENLQCDFFQWADGSDNNNQTIAFNAGPVTLDYASGEVKDFLKENRIKFGHRFFRPGQKEVIEHALRGRDVFVLMPTGGGKSLCYQLPAWCCPGLSVVISPLLSLIQDQVHSLTKLGIETVFLASNQDYSTEQVEITRRLNETSAHGGVKMLYITPEKLNSSPMMQGIVGRLYSRNLISRFIIDEAHCLSDWGHDFRPDYAKLGMIRKEYPKVPLMALTATANGKVVNDAIHALGMRNPHHYVSSFNRPNLQYEVRKKDGKTIDEVARYVSEHPTDAGVIYCLSRKDCESVAEKLQEKVREMPNCQKVIVSYYHAELDPIERERRHKQWSNGVISVLCATIAFGMGIDKPDVRYVIHYSMPKSITHYYQESGRAGRDGEKADCILYYNYKDKKILEHMIMKAANNVASARKKVDQLYSCVRYCEDEFRCRRTMQLEFFGETFDRMKCSKTCDNCKANRQPDRRDLTNVAQEILQLYADLEKQKNGHGITLVQLTELYKGSNNKIVTKFLKTGKLRGFGKGSKYKKHEMDKIAHCLIFERILSESTVQNKIGYSSDYIQLGENANAVERGQMKFFVDFPLPKKENKYSEGVAKDKVQEKAKRRKTAKTNDGGRSVTVPKMTETSPMPCEPLTVEDSDDNGSQGDSLSLFHKSKPDSTSGCAVLPVDATRKLLERIKTLVKNWAEEERMLGKSIFYWNILSNDAMKAIASQAPATIDGLKAVGVLGENIIKDYGERITSIVSAFLTQENLRHLVEDRPLKKVKRNPIASERKDNAIQSKVLVNQSRIVEIDQNSEFDNDLDFMSIEIP